MNQNSLLSNCLRRPAFGALGALALGFSCVPQTNAAPFTYQGNLTDSGQSANGNHSFEFRLFGSQNNNDPLGAAINRTLTVTNGVFSTELDFAGQNFSAGERWLQIKVNSTTLPRQKITAAPLAMALPNVTANGSSVGVGTTSPEGTFDVVGTRGGRFILPNWLVGTGVAEGTQVVARLEAKDDAGPQIRFEGAGTFLDFGQDKDGGFVLEVADTPRLTASTSGSVTINGTLVASKAALAGGAVIVDSTAASKLKVLGDIDAITVTIQSDRNTKESFTPVDPREVLERVASLPITRWQYKNDPDQISHIGPMAQDFHAAFGVGFDERHITTVDADGVALAAIKGLQQELKERDGRIEKLESRLQRLEALLVNPDSNANVPQ